MQEICYSYDGSFTGFLTVIYESIKDRIIPEKIDSVYKNDKDLFSEYIHIASDEKKSNQVLAHLQKDYSKEIIENIFYSFLSNENSIELKIFHYINDIMKNKKNINSDFSNDNVLTIRKVVDKVKFEAHRFMGIIRFAETKDDIYYAPIEPDNNIVYIIAEHFVKRYRSQKFLIHDVARNIGAYYDEKKIDFIEVNLNGKIEDNYSTDEKKYQQLWKSYFKNIAIQERKNPKLQRQFIPIRYWKYLTEKKDC
ncbi:MAG TPA: TIGR03915 family putative DNA repair protein [Spirochaetota bacterium]|nr:TIGR03915 family putative DNA repair protein [Spirochaetota bacterium]